MQFDDDSSYSLKKIVAWSQVFPVFFLEDVDFLSPQKNLDRRPAADYNASINR